LSEGDSIQDRAAAILGKFMFEFGRLERDLMFCVESLRAVSPDVSSRPPVWQLPYKDRLRELETLSGSIAEAEPDFRAQRDEVLAKLESWRVRRNQFAHGRWGIQRDHIAMVPSQSPGIPETKYTLEQFQSELEGLERDRKLFSAFRERWWEKGL
jgi:hypothetical protein